MQTKERVTGDKTTFENLQNFTNDFLRLNQAALQLAGENRAFGLRLPDCRQEVGAGDAHLRQVLRALAECSV